MSRRDRCLHARHARVGNSGFVHEFIGLTGSPPHEAFAAAQRLQQEKTPQPDIIGGFVLLSAPDNGGANSSTTTMTPPDHGELRDLTPKLCPSNLPFFRDDEEKENERSSLAPGEGVERQGSIDGPESPRGIFTGAGDDESGEGGSGAGGVELLAHGAAFVGRHLEIHKIIQSCLHNQLNAVYGERGMGKSALILEAARYLRQRNRFPHGIFCCSLEGLKAMKAVRTRLGVTLNLPARSASDLYDLMARYSSCLLILDRCEDMIRNRRAPFIWFLSQLLQQSSVKVVISSQTPLDQADIPRTEGIQWSAITLGQMRPKDAALLLVENMDREITPDEWGMDYPDDEQPHYTPLDTIASHPLLQRIGGMPAAVRWLARRLSDGTTVQSVQEEIAELSAAGELDRTIQEDRRERGALELTPHGAQTSGGGGGGGGATKRQLKKNISSGSLSGSTDHLQSLVRGNNNDTRTPPRASSSAPSLPSLQQCLGWNNVSSQPGGGYSQKLSPISSTGAPTPPPSALREYGGGGRRGSWPMGAGHPDSPGLPPEKQQLRSIGCVCARRCRSTAERR